MGTPGTCRATHSMRTPLRVGPVEPAHASSGDHLGWSSPDGPASGCGLAAVDSQGVDDQDVEGDRDDRPGGERGEEGEVDAGVHHHEEDADEAGPCLADEHSTTDGHDEQAENEMDPAPGRVARGDQQPALGDDEILVPEECGEPVDGAEEA